MTAAFPISAGCSICGLAEPDPRLLQACFECGNPFHLNPRADLEGRDCGDAWIGESLGIEYYCQTCIDRLQAESMGEQSDPATARYSDLLQAMTPGAPPLAAPAQSSTSRANELPPKPERPRVRRRYRRIDL
jgi:hypothetical protein